MSGNSVIDRNGITYFAFANKKRVMPWSDIVRVTESVILDADGDRYTLEYQLPSKKFRVHGADFIGYGGIKFITLNRLPDKTTVITAAHTRLDLNEVARAFRLWGFPERAANLRTSASPYGSR